MILALHTVDCFGYRLAMTIGISCHVERQRNISYDSNLCIFRQGGQGASLRSSPRSPFDPQPLHALLLGWEDKNQSGAA